MNQATLNADLQDYSEVTTPCPQPDCDATAHVTPELTEDGQHRNEDGEVTMLEFRCDAKWSHGHTHILSHPDSQIKEEVKASE